MNRIWVGSLSLFMLGAIGCGGDPVGPVAVPAPQSQISFVGALPPGLSPNSALVPSALDTEIVNETGNVIWSADGLGTPTGLGNLTIGKPSPAATVRKAILAAATVPGGGAIPDNVIRIDNSPVAWDEVRPGVIGTRNHWANVTSKIASKLNSAAVGPVNFAINEGASNSATDGTVLIVVWEDPAVVGLFSVIVLFGAQSPSGDTFRVFFDFPFTSFGLVEMALAISFGCNSSNACGNPGTQFSTVDVNGQRLTSSAGGQDDGLAENGALITMGGLGDTSGNPPPNAVSTLGNDPDDEYYKLNSFIPGGANSFDVFTRNPSNDDNIFLALIYMNPPGGVESTPGPPPPPNGGGGNPLMCNDAERLIEAEVTRVVNTNFSNFPDFFRNQFINTVMSLARPFIERLTRGDLSLALASGIIGQIKALLATFSIPLSDEFVNGILAIVEDCQA